MLVVDFARAHTQVVVFSKTQYLIDNPYKSRIEEKNNGTT